MSNFRLTLRTINDGFKQLERTIWRLLDFVMLPVAVLYAGLTKLFWTKRKYWPRSSRLMRDFGAFAGRYHYYVPAVHPDEIYRDPDEPRNLSTIDWNHLGQVDWLKRFNFGQELSAFPQKGRPSDLKYFYDNGAFPAGDSEILYSFIRTLRPQKIIEIGSGKSTLMALAAIQKNAEEDSQYNCELTCVEPYANPWLEKTGAKIERSRVELLGTDFFEQLSAGDILFIDSSHVVRAQNDVIFEYLELLPTLKSDVYVHIHDVFSPRDYPRKWLIDSNHQWGEQYLLEAFLSYNSEFEIICACNYLVHEETELFRRACPVYDPEKNDPASFWLRRR